MKYIRPGTWMALLVTSLGALPVMAQEAQAPSEIEALTTITHMIRYPLK